MPEMIIVTGSVGLVDENLTPIGDREPCKFGWYVGSDGWAVQVVSSHALSPVEGAFLVAIYDDRDRLMFAVPIVGRPIQHGGALMLGPGS